LRSVRATIPSVKGDIVVEINRGEGWLSLYLESPEATTAIVGIPKDVVEEMVSLSVNDGRIWYDGQVTGSCNGLEYVGADRYYYRFSVESGTWHFRAEGKDC
jgi:hypothetical protein